MKYIIREHGRTLGVANYPDEAKGFAERMAGRNGGYWTTTGQLLDAYGSDTGWTILQLNHLRTRVSA